MQNFFIFLDSRFRGNDKKGEESRLNGNDKKGEDSREASARESGELVAGSRCGNDKEEGERNVTI